MDFLPCAHIQPSGTHDRKCLIMVGNTNYTCHSALCDVTANFFCEKGMYIRGRFSDRNTSRMGRPNLITAETASASQESWGGGGLRQKILSHHKIIRLSHSSKYSFKV